MSDKAAIEIDDGNITVDAGVIAGDFGIAPADVAAGMREGTITCRCERGIGRDAGRYRLTFFHGGKVLRLIVDQTCRILRRSVVELGDRAMPRAQG